MNTSIISFCLLVTLIAVHGNHKIDRLEQLARTVNEMNETLTKENTALKQENAELKEQLKDIKEMMLKDDMDSHSLKRRRAPTHPVIAFHAARTNNLVLTRDGQTATYDRIITNVGNGYNTYTGRFTSPVKGIYFFTATTQSLSQNDMVQMNIVKNGYEVAYSWSNRSGTTSAILHLEVGDWVEYRRFTGIMTQPYTLRGADQSSFAGVLIAQE